MHAHINVPTCHGQLNFPLLDIFLNALLLIQETLLLPPRTLLLLFVRGCSHTFAHSGFFSPVALLAFPISCMELATKSCFERNIFLTLMPYHHDIIIMSTCVNVLCRVVKKLICVWLCVRHHQGPLPSTHLTESFLPLENLLREKCGNPGNNLLAIVDKSTQI